MDSYQTFATSLSFLIVVLYSILTAIAFRRARVVPDRVPIMERIVVHARRVEGPVFTSMTFTAIILMLAAVSLGDGQYHEIAVVLFGLLRGCLLTVGLFVLYFYWQVRETWR